MNTFDKGLSEQIERLSLDECKKALTAIKKRLKLLNDPSYNDAIHQDIDLMGFSIRARNALKANRLNTVKDILDYGIERIPVLRYVGEKTFKEIKGKVEQALNKERTV